MLFSLRSLKQIRVWLRLENVKNHDLDVFTSLIQKDGKEPPYEDEMHCLKQVVSEEGIGALYSGLVPQLIGIAPEKVRALDLHKSFSQKWRLQLAHSAKLTDSR